MDTKPTTKSSTSADQAPDVLTIDSTSADQQGTADLPVEPLSPFKVQPIRNGASLTARSSAPLKPGAWQFVAGCPVPLTVGVMEDVAAGVAWPHPETRKSWPFWPMIWRRPTEATPISGQLETLAAAQASYDAAVAALRAAGYTVQD